MQPKKNKIRCDMRYIAILILVAIGYMYPCLGASLINHSLDDTNINDNTPTHEEIIFTKEKIGNIGNGNTPNKCPMAYKTALYTRTAFFLHGQFNASVLTLYSANGQLLCEIDVPQGADEVRIPELSDKPVEVHINDGKNDYYGHI